MFCPNCGKEIEGAGVCPHCGVKINDVPQENNDTPVPAGKDSFVVAAQKYWYCFILPVLFFIPLKKKAENPEGNIAVVNNTLWLFIVNLVLNVIESAVSDIFLLSVLIGMLPLALGHSSL